MRIQHFVICLTTLLFCFDAFDKYLGGPFFGENTPSGRIERMQNAELLALVVVLFALLASFSKLTRNSSIALTMFSFLIFSLDAFYFSTSFGHTMLLIGAVGSSRYRKN
jgi:hypothetical protein